MKNAPILVWLLKTLLITLQIWSDRTSHEFVCNVVWLLLATVHTHLNTTINLKVIRNICYFHRFLCIGWYPNLSSRTRLNWNVHSLLPLPNSKIQLSNLFNACATFSARQRQITRYKNVQFSWLLVWVGDRWQFKARILRKERSIKNAINKLATFWCDGLCGLWKRKSRHFFELQD